MGRRKKIKIERERVVGVMRVGKLVDALKERKTKTKRLEFLALKMFDIWWGKWTYMNVFKKLQK